MNSLVDTPLLFTMLCAVADKKLSEFCWREAPMLMSWITRMSLLLNWQSGRKNEKITCYMFMVYKGCLKNNVHISHVIDNSKTMEHFLETLDIRSIPIFFLFYLTAKN